MPHDRLISVRVPNPTLQEAARNLRKIATETADSRSFGLCGEDGYSNINKDELLQLNNRLQALKEALCLESVMSRKKDIEVCKSSPVYLNKDGTEIPLTKEQLREMFMIIESVELLSQDQNFQSVDRTTDESPGALSLRELEKVGGSLNVPLPPAVLDKLKTILQGIPETAAEKK